MAYQTTSIYREKVYNEDAKHKLKILFNGVEYQDIDKVCEKLTINSRIIPNGNTNFALDNFISKEATLILHNVDLEDIVDPVEIQIGTLTNSDSLGDTYEYVPIGIFNIQDIPTTDKDKTTITLRDNAVKFDFPYNAEPLIEGNGGSATKMQIFQDICTQAGVGTNVSHFLKDNELFGGYDNNISGRQYIAYLAEQAGAIAIINRYGNLDFIYLNNLEEQELPLQFVESYQNGDPLEISKVIYESGVIKYECGNETHDTLFLDASNPYINDQDVMLETNGEEIIIEDNKSNFQIFKKDGKCGQDGTPTPSNPVEIDTIKTINLFDGEISVGCWTSTTGQTISSTTSSGFRSSGYIDIEPNTTYIFSGTFVNGNVYIVETNKNGVILAIDGNNGYKQFNYVANVWSYMSFTSHSSAKRLYWYNATGETRPNDVMIEKQFLDEYIPYSSIATENTSSKNLLKREGFATNETDGNYWKSASGTYMTSLENGFCNVTIDNSSGSGNVFCNMRIRPTQFEKLKAGGNYTAFVEIRNVEKTGSADFVLHQLDGTNSSLWIPTTQKTAVTISNTIIRFNFNVSNDLNGKNAIFRSYVRAYPNSKINCDLRLSIYEGSVSQEDFEYQMYGKKRTLIDLSKENLYDSSFRVGTNLDTIYTPSGTVTESNGLFSYTPARSDAYIWEITNQGSTYNGYYSGKLYEFTDETYSVKISNPLFNKNYITYYDENKVSLGYTRFYNSFAFNKSDKQNAKYFSLRIGYGSATSGTTYNFNVTLYKGEDATTPYYELCSLGNVKDELIIENGNAKIIKRIGKNVLNGNENWTRQNTNAGYRYRLSSATIKPTESPSLISNIISSHFEATSANWTWASRMGIAVDDNAFLNICYENESVDTLEKFKTWLQSNNVIVYYELNEPQEIDLGEIEFQNFEGYNDIYTNDNNKSNMYIKYASTKPQIEFIYDILNGFKINSFKTGKILGNPAIDPYDIISVTDYSDNLFDKNNPNVLDAYINNIGTVANSSSDKTIYIPCKPNTTYKVKKMLSGTTSSNRFRLATYQNVPANGSACVDYKGYGSGTDVVEDIITTTENANYLGFFCYTTDSLTTFDKMLDSIEIVEILTYKTLATNTLTYNGKLIQTFDTQVKIGDKQSNVSLMSEPTFQKYAKTNIDNINNNLTMVVAQQNETTQQMSQVIQTVNSIQNTFQVTGGNNLIKDSQGLLEDDVWTKQDGGTYLLGYDADLIGKTIASSKLGISNGKMTSTSENITGLVVGMQYTLSFKISNDANTTTRVKLSGNNVAYDKTFNTNISFQEETFSFIADTSTYVLEIESSTTMDGFGYIYDLMLNKGDALSWEPASGEIVGTVLKMSQLGLQINCTGSDIATLMTSQGFQIKRYSNGTLYEVITEFTSTGLKTKKAETTELIINDFEWKQIRYQYNDTLILYKKESD